MGDEPERSRLNSDIGARRGSCGRRRFFELNRTTGSRSVVTTRSRLAAKFGKAPRHRHFVHEFAGVVEGKAAIELLLQVPLHPCDVYERVESDRVGYSALDFFHNKWGNTHLIYSNSFRGIWGGLANEEGDLCRSRARSHFVFGTPCKRTTI
jgi:hypothetical protein